MAAVALIKRQLVWSNIYISYKRRALISWRVGKMCMCQMPSLALNGLNNQTPVSTTPHHKYSAHEWPIYQTDAPCTNNRASIH